MNLLDKYVPLHYLEHKLCLLQIETSSTLSISMEESTSRKCNNVSAGQNITAFLRTRIFITRFTRTTAGLYPNHMNQDHISHLIFVAPSWILSYHLRLDLPRGLFPLWKPTKYLKSMHFPSLGAYHTSYQSYFAGLRVYWFRVLCEYKLWSSPICDFLISPVAPCNLVPNILLSVVGWETTLQVGRSLVRFPYEVNFFNLPNASSRNMALGSTQSLTEMSTRNLPGGKRRPARKADNLTAICEPIV
jgi:hypothetical protein